jgi:hypothetical protein
MTYGDNEHGNHPPLNNPRGRPTRIGSTKDMDIFLWNHLGYTQYGSEPFDASEYESIQAVTWNHRYKVGTMWVTSTPGSNNDWFCSWYRKKGTNSASSTSGAEGTLGQQYAHHFRQKDNATRVMGNISNSPATIYDKSIIWQTATYKDMENEYTGMTGSTGSSTTIPSRADAEGDIILSDVPADGATVTITDNESSAITYEFDASGAGGGNTWVDTSGGTVAAVTTALVTAIESQKGSCNIRALECPRTSGRAWLLASTNSQEEGNVAITKASDTGNKITIVGMMGGSPSAYLNHTSNYGSYHYSTVWASSQRGGVILQSTGVPCGGTSGDLVKLGPESSSTNKDGWGHNGMSCSDTYGDHSSVFSKSYCLSTWAIEPGNGYWTYPAGKGITDPLDPLGNYARGQYDNDTHNHAFFGHTGYAKDSTPFAQSCVNDATDSGVSTTRGQSLFVKDPGPEFRVRLTEQAGTTGQEPDATGPPCSVSLMLYCKKRRK